MADESNVAASFSTQANALFRKNFIFQINGTTICGVQCSTPKQAGSCPTTNPPTWPALLQIPLPEYRATEADFVKFSNLPNESCRQTGSCPVTTLVTGDNQTLGQILGNNLYPTSSPFNSANLLAAFAKNVVGSSSRPRAENFLDPAFFFGNPLYVVRPSCSPVLTLTLPVEMASFKTQKEIKCVQALNFWRNSSYDANEELYKGYKKGNPQQKIEEIVAAYDFLN